MKVITSIREEKADTLMKLEELKRWLKIFAKGVNKVYCLYNKR